VAAQVPGEQRDKPSGTFVEFVEIESLSKLLPASNDGLAVEQGNAKDPDAVWCGPM
jgi:hypothetical protein